MSITKCSGAKGGTTAMTKQQLEESNARAIAKMRERRERALAAKKAGGLKRKPAQATIHVAPTATPELKEAVVEMAVAAAKAAPAAAPQRDTEKMTLKELRAEAKRLYPELKGMADAARDELEVLLKTPGLTSNSLTIMTFKKAWRHRWEMRVGAWKNGDSPSAQKLREEARKA